MYSISGFGQMIADSVRMDAYSRALRQAIQPGAVVLDIGAGTGILSLLACQYGARRVYAIEPADVCLIAQENAAANGYADRIQCYRQLSTAVLLPEPVDVIVSDLRGLVPLFRLHLPAIVDARRRFLRPGGTLIPQRDDLWAAPVEAPSLYHRFVRGHESNPYGLNFEPALRRVKNTRCKANLTAEQLLAEPRHWATLDYTTLEETDYRGALEWTVARSGTGHGFALWFDATLVPGVTFSNMPGQPEVIYGQAFFPWLKPVPLAKGDCVEVALKADLVGMDYIWRWDSRVLAQGDPDRVIASFQQSTFLGAPLDPARLRKRGTEYVPNVTIEGQIDRAILEMMDGKTPLGEIARSVLERFPGQIGGLREALGRVGEMSMRYGR